MSLSTTTIAVIVLAVGFATNLPTVASAPVSDHRSKIPDLNLPYDLTVSSSDHDGEAEPSPHTTADPRMAIKKKILKPSRQDKIPKCTKQDIIAAADLLHATAIAPTFCDVRAFRKRREDNYNRLDSLLHIDDNPIRTYEDLCHFLGMPPNEKEKAELESAPHTSLPEQSVPDLERPFHFVVLQPAAEPSTSGDQCPVTNMVSTDVTRECNVDGHNGASASSKTQPIKNRRSRRARNIGPECDLNQKTVKENYEELCDLLGIDPDPEDLEFLQASIRNCGGSRSLRAKPITIEVNGEQVYLPEWSQMHSAKSTLVKLVLVAGFCKKLDPIWDSISSKKSHGCLIKQYSFARTIMLCLRRCCRDKVRRFQEGRDNPFKHQLFRSHRCPDHKVSDNRDQADTKELDVQELNLRTIDANYRHLCRLLEKPEEPEELAKLNKMHPKGLYNLGQKSDPVTVMINGEALYLSEWTEMRSAQHTLVKLILAVRFHQKLSPVWDQIDSGEKTRKLENQFKFIRSIVFCLNRCCGKNPAEFRKRWGSIFNHYDFTNRCCSADIGLSTECDYFKRQRDQGMMKGKARTWKPNNNE